MGDATARPQQSDASAVGLRTIEGDADAGTEVNEARATSVGKDKAMTPLEERQWTDRAVAHLAPTPFVPGVSGERPIPLEESNLAVLATPDSLTAKMERHPSWVVANAFVARGAPWEAHEVLEALWHACGRTTPEALVVKACIKLCAADVKRRQGQMAGRRSHAQGAVAIARELMAGTATDAFCGVSLRALYAAAQAMEDEHLVQLQGLPLIVAPT